MPRVPSPIKHDLSKELVALAIFILGEYKDISAVELGGL